MKYLIFLWALLGALLVNSYTISKDSTPALPKEKLVDDHLIRTLPDGSIVDIECPQDTILNKATLTCDFVQGKVGGEFSIQPTDDCRYFKLCDGFYCTITECPGTTLFNVKEGVCDYPEKANCCEFDAKNSSRILQN